MGVSTWGAGWMPQRLSRLRAAICGEERREVPGEGHRELGMKAGPGRLLGGHGGWH